MAGRPTKYHAPFYAVQNAHAAQNVSAGIVSKVNADGKLVAPGRPSRMQVIHILNTYYGQSYVESSPERTEVLSEQLRTFRAAELDAERILNPDAGKTTHRSTVKRAPRLKGTVKRGTPQAETGEALYASIMALPVKGVRGSRTRRAKAKASA